MCRFDFPGQWPSLLSDLGGAAAWGSPMHAVAKLRMLFTLKNVLRALRSKRFVVEAPSSVAGLSQEGELGAGLHKNKQLTINSLIRHNLKS